MIKLIQESFKITNGYLTVATPLILFSLISGLYLIFTSGGDRAGLMFSFILFFLMLCAFLSGWFFMVHKAVRNPDAEDKDRLIFEFPAGVGEYFLPIIGMVIITVFVSFLIFFAALLAGKKFIGMPDVTYGQISAALANMEAMKEFANSLSVEQLIKINKWNMLLFAATLFNHFILMFYSPVLFFKRKNPFIALFISIKDVFCRKFFQNAGLFLFIAFTYLILSVLSAVFGSNIFIHFLLTLANFYYITFVAILVFNYYYSNYAKIGSTVDELV